MCNFFREIKRKDGGGIVIEPKNELERVAQAIASWMPCRCCPCDQCKARENSSIANCVHHWMETMRKVVDESKREEMPAVSTNDGMGDPCITCKMSFESKQACCGCPDRRRWESKQMPKKG